MTFTEYNLAKHNSALGISITRRWVAILLHAPVNIVSFVYFKSYRDLLLALHSPSHPVYLDQFDG